MDEARVESPRPDGETLYRLRRQARLRAAALSLGLGLALTGMKFVAFAWTGSAAVLSDALESIVNVVAASMVFWTVHVSSRPADADHPYGHGKAEDFSAGVEGALIVLAAAAILWQAVPRFFTPAPLAELGRGTLVLAAATLVNLLLGLFLIRVGRRHQSRAIEADGHHVMADVITSIGAVAALLVVRATGWNWVDPLVACLLALHIVGAGLRLVRESVGRLMDEADVELLDRIATQLDRAQRPEWIDVHHLRAWRSGEFFHVDAHLTLPRYWDVQRSHDAEKEVEDAILTEIGPHGEAIVHVDPCRSGNCPWCSVAECPVREAPYEHTLAWTRDRLTGESVALQPSRSEGLETGEIRSPELG